MNASGTRLLSMPAEGVVALQTVIGIIDDHALVADPWVYASLWTNSEWLAYCDGG